MRLDRAVRRRRTVTRRHADRVGQLMYWAMSVPVQSQMAAAALVTVGTPLRVTPVRGPQQLGRFESQTAAELRLRVPCDSGCERLVRTAWTDLRRVEARRRGPGSPIRVAAGALIGYATTYLVLRGVASMTPCTELPCRSLFVEEQAPKLLLAGTLIGTAVGRTSTPHRWEPVWVAGSSEQPR